MRYVAALRLVDISIQYTTWNVESQITGGWEAWFLLALFVVDSVFRQRLIDCNYASHLRRFGDARRQH